MDGSYEELVAAALHAPFSGWDFSYLFGRVRECELPWSYEDMARGVIKETSRVLDVDTGGGELLSLILHDGNPARTVATESWSPNIPIAQKRLAAQGIELRPTRRGEPLPAEDGEFTVVLNRHGGCDPDELARVLESGGTYLTQGVGRLNDVELNSTLQGPPPGYRESATLDDDCANLVDSGFRIVDTGEVFAEYGFRDIGAVVFHLRAVPWQVPGFDVTAYDAGLRRIDAQIRRDGEFVVRHHRYYIRAIAS